MKVSIKLIAICFLLFLAGCANTPSLGPKFTETANMTSRAKIHVYRPSSFFMSLVNTNIFIDGEVRSVLSSGSYNTLLVDPGIHRFKAKQQPSRRGGYSAMLGDTELEIDYKVEAGGIYYLVWAPSSVFSNSYEPYLLESQAVQSNNIAFGALVQGKALFGFVTPSFAKEEITTTEKSNSVPDPSRI